MLTALFFAKVVFLLLFVGTMMTLALLTNDEIDDASMGMGKLGVSGRAVVLVMAPSILLMFLFIGARGDLRRFISDFWQLIVYGRIDRADPPSD